MLAVLPGEPAPIWVTRRSHANQGLVLEGGRIVMRAFLALDDEFAALHRHQAVEFMCPEHRNTGHFVGGEVLRQELEEARRSGGGRGIDVARVVVPYFDGSDYAKS